MPEKLSFKEDSKIHSAIVNSSIQCPKCKRRIAIMHDKLVCKSCGTLVFKHKKDEFIFRLKEKKVKISG